MLILLQKSVSEEDCKKCFLYTQKKGGEEGEKKRKRKKCKLLILLQILFKLQEFRNKCRFQDDKLLGAVRYK